MFYVDKITRSVTLTRGDTGPLVISAEDYAFKDDDRAIFTVVDANCNIVIDRILTPQGGKFRPMFKNEDTKYLPPGDYSIAVTFVLHPYYDASGRIVNGDQILSFGNITLMLLPAANNI